MAKKYLLNSNFGLVIILAVTLVLTACSDDSATAPAPTQPSPPTVATGGTPVKAIPNPPVSPASGGFPYDCAKIFCFGLAQEPVGLVQGRGLFDPANLVDRPSLQIVRQVYETLFEFKSPDMLAQPATLVKYSPKISADGLTYIIRIGKGLRFSDDTPLDAQAIKFNFDRWSDPGNLYHKGDFQTWATYFGGFPGNLASITADEVNNTVTLKLNQPMANLFQVLAMPQFSIISPSSFDPKSGQQIQSYGSGFYLIEKWSREPKYVLLNRNKLYYQERYAPGDPAAPVVKSPQILALVLQQKQEGLDELRKGTIGATDKIRPEQLPEAVKDPGLVLLDRKPLDVAFLGMNHLRPPFNNITVRSAFASAIDTRSLVQNFYFGLGQPAGGLLPPAAVSGVTSPDPYPYDVERARRLLDISGYNSNNPLRLDLWVLPVPRPYYPDPKKIADAIASDLAKVGVIITVRDSSSWPRFYADRQNSAMDFYMFGWQGYSGDPNEFLGEFFGKLRGEGGFENQTLLVNIQNDLLQRDPKTRDNLYKEALGIISDQVPVLPLAYVKGVVAVRPNVKGYVPNPTGIESWASVELVPSRP